MDNQIDLLGEEWRRKENELSKKFTEIEKRHPDYFKNKKSHKRSDEIYYLDDHVVKAYHENAVTVAMGTDADLSPEILKECNDSIREVYSKP